MRSGRAPARLGAAAATEEIMSEILLSVRPAAGGWTIESTEGVEPLLFLSGGVAERSARALAATLAESGAHVRLVVEDRASRVVGTAEFDPG